MIFYLTAAKVVRWREVSWCAGLVALAGGAVLDHHDLRAHMLGHLLLGMVAPLLLVLAAPVTLALRILPVGAARRLVRLLRTRPVRVLTHPVTAAVLNAGGLWLWYATGLFGHTADRPWLHALVQIHVFAAGCLFTASIAGPDPMPHRPALPVRAAVLFAFLTAHGILAKHLYAHPPMAAPEDVSLQAAQFMYYGGDLVDLVLIVRLGREWWVRRSPLRHPAAAPGSSYG